MSTNGTNSLAVAIAAGQRNGRRVREASGFKAASRSRSFIRLLRRGSSLVLGFCAGLIAFPEASVQAQDVNLYAIPNQSAHFVRMPSRESSTEIDAVYANPAGVVELPEGFHLSLNNQFLRQATSVTSEYQYLNQNPKTYEGVASSLIFPSVFVAYRKSDWAISGGVFMVAGAGGASFDNVPSADAGIADLVPLMQFSPLNDVDAYIEAETGENPGYSNLTDYRFNFFSDGYGVTPVIQGNFSYRINKAFAISGGARFVYQYQYAESVLDQVEVYHSEYGGWQSPESYLQSVAADDRLDVLRQTVVTALAEAYGADATNAELDASRAGIGFTPIIGIHIRPSDRVNIGLRYEHNTAISVKTTVNDGKDALGLYVDGEEFRSDLPGVIAGGLHYDLSDKIDIKIGGRILLDKSADLNGRDSLINSNYYEVAVAGQYELSDRIRLSCGYTYNAPGVDPLYQNEADYRIAGHTGAFGGAYDLSDKFQINAGVMYTAFISESHVYGHEVGQNAGNVLDNRLTFEKNALVGALGIDYRILR